MCERLFSDAEVGPVPALFAFDEAGLQEHFEVVADGRLPESLSEQPKHASGPPTDTGLPAYHAGVKEIASGRIGLAAAKYSEQAPMATVCCNACRTCVTTNLVGVALLGITGFAAFARRLIHRQPAQILGTNLGDRFGATQGRSGSLNDQVTRGRQPA